MLQGDLLQGVFTSIETGCVDSAQLAAPCGPEEGVPVEEDLLRKWGKGSIRRKYYIDLPEPIDQRDGPALVDLAPRSYAFLELKDAAEA